MHPYAKDNFQSPSTPSFLFCFHPIQCNIKCGHQNTSLMLTIHPKLASDRQATNFDILTIPTGLISTRTTQNSLKVLYGKVQF